MNKKFVGRFLIRVLIVCVALSFQLAPHAASAQAYVDRLVGTVGGIFYTQYDPTGCIQTWVGVGGGELAYLGEPQFPDESIANIYIERYDVCLRQMLFNVYEPWLTIGPDDFVLDRSSSTASLNTTVSVTDTISNVTVPVEVHLNWSGDFEPYTLKSRWLSIGNYVYNWHDNGLLDLDAKVEGTLLVNGDNLFPGTLYTGFLNYYRFVQSSVDLTPGNASASNLGASGVFRLLFENTYTEILSARN